MNKEKILNSLNSTLDKKDIKLDKDSLIKYSCDWSKLIPSDPMVIVFPRELSQVIDIINLCNSFKQTLIGSGGRTGLTGGATCIENEIILSFEKMNQIIEFDDDDSTLLCEPGVITASIQKYANERDLYYPVDFSSAGSSQIGGNIATNAGGIKVFRYGLTSNYVKGLYIVDGNAKTYNFDQKLVKNATGPNQKNFFIGSEGVFGLITRCRLQLIPKPDQTKIALLGFNDLNELNEIRDSLIRSNDIEAIEFFTYEACKEVEKEFDLKNPISNTKYFIIIEYFHTKVEKILETLLELTVINEVIVSQSESDKIELWKYRLFISESLYKNKPTKLDIAVPIKKYPEIIHKVENIFKDIINYTLVLFGHIADGNIHINYFSEPGFKESQDKKDEIELRIYELVIELNGTISAEHGIGFLKKELLKRYLPKNDMETLRVLKKHYDPNLILSPKKLIS